MSTKPVYLFAKWHVKEGQVEMVLGLLTTMAAETAREKGNLFYKIHQSNSDAHMLMLYEGYVDDAAVEAHRGAGYFKQLVLEQIVPLLESREVMLASELSLL